MPLAGHRLRLTALRQPVGRPQLKRDPLGSSRVILMLFRKRTLREVAATWIDQVQVLSSSPFAVRRVRQQFRQAGATVPQRAQAFHAHSQYEERAFRYLLCIEAMREPSPGRYYLDEGSLPSWRRRFLLPWW